MGRGLLEELGVRKIINAAGTLTMLGGTTLSDEVLEAIQEASRVYVDMSVLHVKAGEFIARLVGAEAAYITSGAAAGLVLSVSACLTRLEESKMTMLPRLSGKVLVQKAHRNMYDYNLELSGAEIVEIGTEKGTSPEDLERAIGSDTAAVVYFVFDPQENILALDTVLEIAHRHQVPVIVDAAAELPPRDNLRKFIRMGADLVLFSGGKDIGAPNDTGVILGRKDLVKLCMRLGPHSYEKTDSGMRIYIGRPMKVSKEDILGLVSALKLYFQLDEDEKMRRWERKVDFLVSEL